MPRLLAFVCFLFAPQAIGAPPALTQLVPSGGQQGKTVEVLANGTFERWPVQVWTSSPSLQAKPGDKGKLSVLIAADAIPTVHWIRLYDAEGATVARPFLVGTLPEISEKEPNNTPDSAQKIEGRRVVVNGRFEKAADADVFSIELKKGQTFVAAMEARRHLRSPMDGVLQILDAEGNVLAQNNDHVGYDPLLAFNVPKDGVYLIRAFAFPSMPDSTVRFAGGEKFLYRLTLTDGPYADHAFPPVVSRQAPGAAELVGWNLPTGLKSKVVRVPDQGESALLHDAELPHAVSVALTNDPVVVSANDKQPLPIPSSVCGRIAKRGEVAAYAFAGKKGQKAEWRLESASVGFDLDGLLRLLDGKGKILAEAKSATLGVDPQIAHAFPEDAEVRIEVRDLTRQAGMRHVFRLAASLQEPDFAVKLATDRFTQKIGQPLEIDVAFEPRHGFKQPVELELVGGMAKFSTKTKDAKTLTLRLEPSAAPFAGPIRILARIKGLPPRVAIAAVADLDRTTDELWLTVTPK